MKAQPFPQGVGRKRLQMSANRANEANEEACKTILKTALAHLRKAAKIPEEERAQIAQDVALDFLRLTPEKKSALKNLAAWTRAVAKNKAADYFRGEPDGGVKCYSDQLENVEAPERIEALEEYAEKVEGPTWEYFRSLPVGHALRDLYARLNNPGLFEFVATKAAGLTIHFPSQRTLKNIEALRELEHSSGLSERRAALASGLSRTAVRSFRKRKDR